MRACSKTFSDSHMHEIYEKSIRAIKKTNQKYGCLVLLSIDGSALTSKLVHICLSLKSRQGDTVKSYPVESYGTLFDHGCESFFML